VFLLLLSGAPPCKSQSNKNYCDALNVPYPPEAVDRFPQGLMLRSVSRPSKTQTNAMIDRMKSTSHIIRDNGLSKQLAPVITARIRAIRITDMLQGTGARI
jgi:hypothetical protein